LNVNLRCDWLWLFHHTFNVEVSFVAAVGKKPEYPQKKSDLFNI